MFYAGIYNFDRKWETHFFLCECASINMGGSICIGNVCNTESNNNNCAHLNWLAVYVFIFIYIHSRLHAADSNEFHALHTFHVYGILLQIHLSATFTETRKHFINGKLLLFLSRSVFMWLSIGMFISCCHCRVILIRCRQK